MKHSKNSGKSKKNASGSARRAGSSSRKRGSSRSTPPGPVLGLDLSMTGTGLVVLDGNKILRKRRYKTAPAPPPDGLKLRPQGQLAQDRFLGSEEERIAWIAERVVLAVKKFKTPFCVIEAHAFAAQGRGKTVLAELAGVVKHYLNMHEVAFVTISPMTIKKHVTGSGKAQKMDMINAAKAAGHKISDSDTADAWACARYGWDEYKNLVALTENQE